MLRCAGFAAHRGGWSDHVTNKVLVLRHALPGRRAICWWGSASDYYSSLSSPYLTPCPANCLPWLCLLAWWVARQPAHAGGGALCSFLRLCPCASRASRRMGYVCFISRHSRLRPAKRLRAIRTLTCVILPAFGLLLIARLYPMSSQARLYLCVRAHWLTTTAYQTPACMPIHGV